MRAHTTREPGTPAGVFGAELRHSRSRAELSQKDLAAQANVFHDVISKAEVLPFLFEDHVQTREGDVGKEVPRPALRASVAFPGCISLPDVVYGRRVTPYADQTALIDDPRVLRIAITDCGEPLVDVRIIAGVAVDQSRAEVQQLSDDPFRVRAGVAERLASAQARLPGGYQLQVKEGWRPIWVQQRLWDGCLDRLRARRPELSPEQARRENARFVAPPGITPPHSTGGAVDVVLLYDGNAADMGWGFNEPGEGSRTAASVPSTARRYRDVLASAMSVAGFINYPAEWWHWSYGDRYWAFQAARRAARYGPL